MNNENPIKLDENYVPNEAEILGVLNDIDAQDLNEKMEREKKAPGEPSEEELNETLRKVTEQSHLDTEKTGVVVISPEQEKVASQMPLEWKSKDYLRNEKFEENIRKNVEVENQTGINLSVEFISSAIMKYMEKSLQAESEKEKPSGLLSYIDKFRDIISIDGSENKKHYLDNPDRIFKILIAPLSSNKNLIDFHVYVKENNLQSSTTVYVFSCDSSGNVILD